MQARRRVAVSGFLLATATLVSCSSGSSGATPAQPAGPASVSPAATAPSPPPSSSPDAGGGGGSGGDDHGGGGGGGRGGGSAAAATLPSDWPTGLPLPPGTLQGATGGRGQWTAQLVAAGSADDVRRQTETFYAARGFATSSTPDVLTRGPLRLVVVTENRDHSATSTTVVLGLTQR